MTTNVNNNITSKTPLITPFQLGYSSTSGWATKATSPESFFIIRAAQKTAYIFIAALALIAETFLNLAKLTLNAGIASINFFHSLVRQEKIEKTNTDVPLPPPLPLKKESIKTTNPTTTSTPKNATNTSVISQKTIQDQRQKLKSKDSETKRPVIPQNIVQSEQIKRRQAHHKEVSEEKRLQSLAKITAKQAIETKKFDIKEYIKDNRKKVEKGITPSADAVNQKIEDLKKPSFDTIVQGIKKPILKKTSNIKDNEKRHAERHAAVVEALKLQLDPQTSKSRTSVNSSRIAFAAAALIALAGVVYHYEINPVSLASRSIDTIADLLQNQAIRLKINLPARVKGYSLRAI